MPYGPSSRRVPMADWQSPATLEQALALLHCSQQHLGPSRRMWGQWEPRVYSTQSLPLGILEFTLGPTFINKNSLQNLQSRVVPSNCTFLGFQKNCFGAFLFEFIWAKLMMYAGKQDLKWSLSWTFAWLQSLGSPCQAPEKNTACLSPSDRLKMTAFKWRAKFSFQWKNKQWNRQLTM